MVWFYFFIVYFCVSDFAGRWQHPIFFSPPPFILYLYVQLFIVGGHSRYIAYTGKLFVFPRFFSYWRVRLRVVVRVQVVRFHRALFDV